MRARAEGSNIAPIKDMRCNDNIGAMTKGPSGWMEVIRSWVIASQKARNAPRFGYSNNISGFPQKRRLSFSQLSNC